LSNRVIAVKHEEIRPRRHGGLAVLGATDLRNKRWLVRYLPLSLLALFVIYAAWRIVISLIGTDVIEYQGQRIRLSQKYLDFDEYKNDPSNIDPSETGRVQRLVEQAPIAHSFSTRADLFEATGQIQFPGYGIGGGGGSQPDGSELLAVTIEIPRADKDRYLLFRGRNGTYELVDDFVEREISYPFSIQEGSGEYLYYTRDHQVFFRRPLQTNFQVRQR